MSQLRWGLILSVLSFMLPSLPVRAEGEVYSGITQDQVAALLSAKGLSARRDEGLFRLDSGLIILVTDCFGEQNACHEIRFSRGFNNVRPPLAAVNEWNLRYKIPEAAIDDEGRLRLEMWLSAIGMTEAIFFDTLSWFEGSWDTNDYWRRYATSKTGT
ncbi:MAG: YbjN domain-containing protein [Alphaproteobacteria bacterium]